jgi:Chondroitinase B
MASFLDKNEFSRTEGAEITVFRSPVPIRIVSNGEFTPILQTEQQKQVEARIGELADAYGARHGLDRRRFLETSCGMAAAFLAMNQACKADAAECFIESGANTVVVASMAALANAVNTAPPGRNILIAPGVYNGLTQTFNRNGTQANPIVIRPRDGLGTVTINTPRWTLADSSSWLVFEKLYFTAARNTIMGSHNRISRCRFRNINVDSSLVINTDSSGGARDCRVDHCDFGDFRAPVPAIHIRPGPFRNGTAARVLIDYCYFHDHLQSTNVIYSFASPASIDLPRGQTIILDHCLFHNINASGEYTIIKIGGWITRFCTFTNMNGYLQSRSAANCELRSCWFEGSSHEATKWFGPGHLLIGNRLAGNINLWVPCGNGAFADIKAGTVPINRYAPSTNCLIIGNRMGSGNIIVGEFWSNNPAPGASVRANNNSLQANTRDGGGNAHLLLSTKHGLTPPHTNTTVSGSTSQSFVPAVKLTATDVGLNAPDPLCD